MINFKNEKDLFTIQIPKEVNAVLIRTSKEIGISRNKLINTLIAIGLEVLNKEANNLNN